MYMDNQSISIHHSCQFHPFFTTVRASFVLVETLTIFCSVREVIDRKDTHAPQQSKPTVAKPGFKMCENFPNFSTA
jgi:hypothetical protein